MDQPKLPLTISPTPARRGRPPGAKAKRSLDLARYIEATFAGATPGQQAAQLSMVSPREMKSAKADAIALGLVDLDLPPLTLAMAVKATKLAVALKCDRRDAWLLIQKEREGLMPYVHQKLAPKADEKPGSQLAQVFMIPDGADTGALADFSEQDEGIIEFVDNSGAPTAHVGQAKSDADT